MDTNAAQYLSLGTMLPNSGDEVKYMLRDNDADPEYSHATFGGFNEIGVLLRREIRFPDAVLRETTRWFIPWTAILALEIVPSPPMDMRD